MFLKTVVGAGGGAEDVKMENNYIKRSIDNDLAVWKNSADRIVIITMTAVMLAVVSIYSQINLSPVTRPSVTTFVDKRDDKAYKTVKIGEQTWMAENLNYNAQNSKCYDNKNSNCAKYGRLYDWTQALEACPAGWHLPSDDEWTKLENAVGGRHTAGKKLKSKTGWNNNGNGTDGNGFTALPGGSYNGGFFTDIGNYGYWWSATERNARNAGYRYMIYLSEFVSWDDYSKKYLFSVRCVADVEE